MDEQARDSFETLFAGQADAEAAEADDERSASKQRRLVAFELGSELYGIEITDVTEIREPLPVVPLPFAPAYILGLINLRGAVLPVLDLRRRFGLEVSPEGPQTRLIVLKGPGYQVCLLADTVLGLARVRIDEFRPAPVGVAQIDSEYYDQVLLVGERMLIELNIQKMLRDTAAAEGNEAR